MNRYGRGPIIGGPSKATASTTCQKCLKKDVYECKAVVQERPYVSRPSRTQQLLNPKLVPKLTSDTPQPLLNKKGLADQLLAKAELERGRKREGQSEDLDIPTTSKRIRSASSGSVSTISTGMSRSPSPEQNRNAGKRRPRSPSTSKSHPRKDSFRRNPRPTFSRSPSPRPAMTDSERKRRRNSVSSMESYSGDDRRGARDPSRSTRRKFNEASPPARGRRAESRSRERGRRPLSNDRRVPDRGQDMFHKGGPAGPPRGTGQENRAPSREKSLSPFSKRLALTQSMNMRQ